MEKKENHNQIVAILSPPQIKSGFTNPGFSGEYRAHITANSEDGAGLLFTSQFSRQGKDRFSETVLLFLPGVIYLQKWVNFLLVDMFVCECLAALPAPFCPLRVQRNLCT